MAMRSTEAGPRAEIQHPTGSRLPTLSEEHAPARSVGLITAAMSGAFHPVGGRALEVVSTEEVVSMAAVVVDIADRRYQL